MNASSSLADRAYRELRAAIVDRRLEPGSPIVETDLAEMLGVSRTPVREALRRCDDTYPGQPNRIGAQAHLQGFYGRHGYVPVGETYLEDGIVHIDMERAAT